MMTFLRKHRGWLMSVIAILVVPFCLYFVKTDSSAIRRDQFARIYDRNVSVVEAQKHKRMLDLARAIGLTDLQQNLTAGAKDQNEAITEFILSLLVLRHESEQLGIRPTQAEIIDVIHNLPAFHSDLGFDLKKYDDFVQNALSPNGMRESHIEEVVGDEICLKRIKQLVATGVSLPESESKENFERAYDKMYVSVIRLGAAEVAKDIKLTDEEIQKYFEAHKAEYKTEEKRKVEFVELSLSEEQKKLTGRDRIDALQKLSDGSNDLTQALLEKGADFKQVAAKFQLPVHTTGEFTANAPDAELKAAPQVAGAAFKLTPQDPNSDPFQVADGFYIMHLDGIVESRPLSLEEAKPKIVEAIKRSRSRELLSIKGSEIAHQLREATKSAQTLEAAIQKTGAKAETVPPFSLIEDPKEKADDKKADDKKAEKEPPDFVAIKNASARLEPGEVSEFFPWEDGGLIVILEKREPPDPAKYAEAKAAFDTRYLNNKRELVFYEWLRDRQREAGLLAETPETAALPRKS